MAHGRHLAVCRRLPARQGGALQQQLDHPKGVYLREDAIVPKLDGWLSGVFDPANLEVTCAAMADAQRHDETAASAAAARAEIAECESRVHN